ncbi:MAG: GNAT family N-acetyltransferase [Candidatus Eisenbacteria sp.]|nr:GNAT family N-acetyltransferase [Candidatus Eisenbacteria bacterium]
MMASESRSDRQIAVTFQRLDPAAGDELIRWLASDCWPFHKEPKPDPARLAVRLAEGFFASEDNQTFWILDGAGEKVGVIRIMDFSDEVPMFDLRVRTDYRGRGIGAQTLRWLAGYIFSLPGKIRIEGQTRRDNLAMRRTFRRCGWVKEAHYRSVWPTADGRRVDAIGYGILKSDWEQGTVTPVEWDDDEGLD